jgi:hypothetical protein
MNHKGFVAFTRGLIEYDLTPEEFYKYKVIRPEHKSLMYNNEVFPPHMLYCVCGQKIQRNMHVINVNETDVKKRIIVVGSCCIKKFTETGLTRRCDICNKRHNNNEYNKCPECKFKYCYKCTNMLDGEVCVKQLCNACREIEMIDIKRDLPKLNICQTSKGYELINNNNDITLTVDKCHIHKTDTNKYIISDIDDVRFKMTMRYINDTLEEKLKKIGCVYKRLSLVDLAVRNFNKDYEIRTEHVKLKIKYVWMHINFGEKTFGILPEIIE